MNTLKILEVSQNYFSGTVSTMMLSKNLEILDLYNNLFSQSLPDSVSELCNLLYFSVGYNSFGSDLKNIFNSTCQSKLTYVDLGTNVFSGQLPDEIFNLQSLQVFTAQTNCLRGSLPNNICNVNSLVMLNLNGMSAAPACQNIVVKRTGVFLLRHIISNFQPCLINMPNLQSLNLASLSLQSIVENNVAIGDKLRVLDMSYNKLTGSLPSTIQHHVWDFLDLTTNRFKGTLFAFISNAIKEYFNINQYKSLVWLYSQSIGHGNTYQYSAT